MSSGTATAATTSSKQSSSHTTNGTAAAAAAADELVPAAMSTSALEAKLRELREKSNKHSQLLTAKLASSQSGQNLLHIGTSLSTLPPDLHSLLTQLHPVLSSAETTEKVYHEHLTKLVECGNAIRQEQRRVVYTQDAADLYEDLVAAERVVQVDIKSREHEREQRERRQRQSHHHHHGKNITSSSTGSVASSTAASSSRRQYSFDSVNQNDDTDDDDDDDDNNNDDRGDNDQKRQEEKSNNDKLDHVSSLERCAQTTLILVKDLQASTEVIAALTAGKVSGSVTQHQAKDVSATSGGAAASQESKNSNSAGGNASASSTTAMVPSMRTPLDDDTERAQFLMKLAPRIRRLESGTINSLTYQMEQILQTIQERRRRKLEREEEEEGDNTDVTSTDGNNNKNKGDGMNESDLLLMLGHCMRGLALLGRGKEVENIFARIAIMPLIRSKLSMGQLDEGGPRGECTGLKSLLEDIIVTIGQTFGPVIQLSEVMFDVRPKVQVDLITGGVWVPIATALMADAGIKMAIFSPGIASILQSNYLALDNFLSELSSRLLLETPEKAKGSAGDKSTVAALEHLYFTPTVSAETVERAQSRIFTHPKTAEFSKRWNLPIYYQLRFGDCCTRLNKAIDLTTRGGWSSEVYSGDTALAETLRNTVGFELSFFLELYDILLGLWRPDVILRPLTNRFLRGAVQLVGRSVAFIRDGMDGKIKFGGPQSNDGASSAVANGSAGQQNGGVPLPSSRMPYSWGDSAPDVASVAWELAVLDTSLSHEYVSTICNALNTPSSTQSDREELRGVVSEIFSDTSSQIRPIVERAWNEIIVKLLVEKCSAPLGAVKGVVATYRMTNRPPPTQASPYVATILRPLKEFSRDFELRTPDHIGSQWKISILTAVTEKYSAAVEELIATVQRTESALQSRRARRTTSGGISDGDKVKLQLYLDFQAFCRDVQEVGVTPSSIEGIAKLQELTREAQKIQE